MQSIDPQPMLMGRMQQVRVYAKALDPADVMELAHLAWTEDCLRRLRVRSYATQETLTAIRTTQSTEAAKRRQQAAIDLFFLGGEILRLLHPQMLLLHSPVIRW